MFCKHCGTNIGDGKNFCPNCGAAVTPAASSVGAKPATNKKTVPLMILLPVIIGVVIIGILAKGGNDISKPLSKAELLVGTWENGGNNITFKSDGTVRLGNSNLGLGVDVLKYELVNDSIIYITGDGIPAGIEMGCNISEDTLILSLYGESVTFTKSK